MDGKAVDVRMILREITARALEDPQFRLELTASPKEAIEGALGIQLPADLWVEIIQQEPNSLYLLLPPSQESSDELSEADLAEVTGGSSPIPEFVSSGGTAYVYENGRWVARIEPEGE